MTTQEIHDRLNHRAGKIIPIKHLLLLIVRQLRTGKLFGKKFAKPPKLWAYLHSISKNKRNMKVNLQLITASVLSFGGLVLLFCGLFIDPEGQIHESLLVAFGEVATFSGALMGIDYVYKKRS